MHPTMPRMRRWRAFWLAIALTSGIAWAASGISYIEYRSGADRGSIEVGTGGIWVYWIDLTKAPILRANRSPLGFGIWKHGKRAMFFYKLLPHVERPLAALTIGFVPLWIPTLLFLAIAARPWGIVGFARAHRASRRRAHGLCVFCGYDMNASAGGVCCPECGRGL